jgi:hypothetical protein
MDLSPVEKLDEEEENFNLLDSLALISQTSPLAHKSPSPSKTPKREKVITPSNLRFSYSAHDEEEESAMDLTSLPNSNQDAADLSLNLGRGFLAETESDSPSVTRKSKRRESDAQFFKFAGRNPRQSVIPNMQPDRAVVLDDEEEDMELTVDGPEMSKRRDSDAQFFNFGGNLRQSIVPSARANNINDAVEPEDMDLTVQSVDVNVNSGTSRRESDAHFFNIKGKNPRRSVIAPLVENAEYEDMDLTEQSVDFRAVKPMPSRRESDAHFLNIEGKNPRISVIAPPIERDGDEDMELTAQSIDVSAVKQRPSRRESDAHFFNIKGKNPRRSLIAPSTERNEHEDMELIMQSVDIMTKTDAEIVSESVAAPIVECAANFHKNDTQFSLPADIHPSRESDAQFYDFKSDPRKSVIKAVDESFSYKSDMDMTAHSVNVPAETVGGTKFTDDSGSNGIAELKLPFNSTPGRDSFTPISHMADLSLIMKLNDEDSLHGGFELPGSPNNAKSQPASYVNSQVTRSRSRLSHSAKNTPTISKSKVYRNSTGGMLDTPPVASQLQADVKSPAQPKAETIDTPSKIALELSYTPDIGTGSSFMVDKSAAPSTLPNAEDNLMDEHMSVLEDSFSQQAAYVAESPQYISIDTVYKFLEATNVPLEAVLEFAPKASNQQATVFDESEKLKIGALYSGELKLFQWVL